MASSAQHIAARNDNDLVQRLIAMAEQAGIPNAQQWVESKRGALVSVDLDETPEGVSSIADVHAYAVATYVPALRPGENPAVVTDAQLSEAIELVFNA